MRSHPSLQKQRRKKIIQMLQRQSYRDHTGSSDDTQRIIHLKIHQKDCHLTAGYVLVGAKLWNTVGSTEIEFGITSYLEL